MTLLGFIRKKDRTQAHHDAHYKAEMTMYARAIQGLPVATLSKGQAIRLFDAWGNPDVVKDVGLTFNRIHQLTGSCVWAGGTNAVFSTIAAQRLAATNPTKAFLPFTLQNYAMSRHYMGDDGQGEGSLGSTFAQSLAQDGITEWTPGTNDIPSFTQPDGIEVTSSVEMSWSSYRDPDVAKVVAVSKAHLFGSTAVCKTTQDIAAAITNGYGVSFACDNYIGDASIQGSGDEACVMGYWNGRGGHQQSIHAVWEHPSFGRLFWAQNNWDGSTYPKDPAGGPICGCWVTEAHVQSAIDNLDAEVYALSHLAWFPAQPLVPSVLIWDV